MIKAGHTESECVVDVQPTIFEFGEGHTYCTVCNEKIKTNISIPRITSAGLTYEINSDGKTCSITGVGNCGDTKIGIPESINGYKVTRIGSNAFSGKNAITEIYIPDSVTSIEFAAFYGCTSLTSVTIGSSVTSIGEDAFCGCKGLKSVTFEGTKSEWNSISKDSYWKYSAPFTVVHCTDGDVSV